MNKKIESEIAIGILIIVAILVGGAFWMRAEKAQAPEVQTAVEAPVMQTRPGIPIKQQETLTKDQNTAIIQTLSAKWSSSGLTHWENKELLNSEIIGILPAETTNFKIVSSGDQSAHYAELGTLLGKISAKVVSKNELFGDAQVSVTSLSLYNSSTLESWINEIGTTMHNNYCEKNGVDDLRYPGNKTCITKISIVKKISDNIIEWNPDFIGSPDILSVSIGNTVLSFEMSQDVSRGKVDFGLFLQDIAPTLQDMAPISQNN